MAKTLNSAESTMLRNNARESFMHSMNITAGICAFLLILVAAWILRYAKVEH